MGATVSPRAAQGSKIYISDMASPEDWEEIVGAQGIDGPDLAGASEIDMTHLGSTRKEKVLDLPDGGQVTFDMVMDFTNDGQAALLAAIGSPTPFRYKEVFSDANATTLIYEANVMGVRPSANTGSGNMCNVTLSVTGDIEQTSGV